MKSKDSYFIHPPPIELQLFGAEDILLLTMASFTMTAPLFVGAHINQKPALGRRTLIVAKASGVEGQDTVKAAGSADKGSNGRRAVMFAAAAAAVCAIGSGVQEMASAEELKRGSPEAKKKYAPVCVTMPTARICRY